MRNKILVLASMLLLLVASAFATVETQQTVFEVGTGVNVGLEIGNSCPEITSTPTYHVDTYADVNQICQGEPICMGICTERLEQGRSYAFDGETINFEVDVTDNDGILNDCVSVVVTLAQTGYDPIVAGCTLDTSSLTNGGKTGTYHCTYTVESAEVVDGEWWVSVQASQTCDQTCVPDSAPGVFSVYLNPAVGLDISSQQPFKFGYDVNGNEVPAYAGDTVYSPYFTVENIADKDSGLYILLALYGTDMYADTSMGGPAPICPTSNVLDIKNVEYMASHLNVQQPWTVMPENYAGRKWVFQSPGPFVGNFIGIGDDITARLRLNIPTPCKGSFTNGGQIVFVGTVI